MKRLFLLLTLGACLLGLGLDDAGAQSLQAEPSRARLRIEGPVSISGQGSIALSSLPEGDYRLVAEGPGLAAARAHFEIDGLGLSPRSWSGPTAMLRPPGLDHLRNGEGRGWLHLGTATLSGTFWVLGLQAVDGAEERIARAELALNAAEDAGRVDAAAFELAEARAEKVDAERVRNLWALYFFTTWASAGLESWLLTPEPSVVSTSQGTRMSLPEVTRWGAAARSALVPGAGQRYLGRDTRANVFTTLVAVSAAGAILTQDAFLEARREESTAKRLLAAADTPAEREQLQAETGELSSDKDTLGLVRWLATGTAAYCYLWNVIDAFRAGQQMEPARQGPVVSLAPLSNGMALTLRWRFH